MINILKQFLDWLYLRSCYICKVECSKGLVCEKCFSKIKYLPCQKLKSLDNVEVYSAGLYENELSTLIKALKFHNRRDIAINLAEYMKIYWKNLNFADEFEIVPVPIHKKKKHARGFNHMDLIAKEFSKLTGMPVNGKVISRIKNTKAQHGLNKIERAKNIDSAFKVNRKCYNNKPLLIIDDIFTSGATMKEIISTFNKADINDLTVFTTSYKSLG